MKFIKILTATKLISRRENNLESGLRYHRRQSGDNLVFFLGSLMPICLRSNRAIRLQILSCVGHGNAQQVSRLKSLIKFKSNFLKSMMSEAFINLAVVPYKLFLFPSFLSLAVPLAKSFRHFWQAFWWSGNFLHACQHRAYRCKDLIDMMFHGDDWIVFPGVLLGCGTDVSIMGCRRW